MRRLLTLLCSGLFLVGQASAHLRLRAIGDIQVANVQELEYLSRSLLPELMVPAVGDTVQVLNLFMGDQTNKDLTLMPAIRGMLDCLPDGYHTVLGNHDRDLDGHTPVDSTYRAVFGAPDYSLDLDNVHLMVLNDVYALRKRDYEGRLTEAQLAWLRQDLQQSHGQTHYVLAMHIPAFELKNAEALLEVFEQQGVKHLLILSAHLHQVARGVMTRPSGMVVQELSVGATCGHWWRGERNDDGVPHAMMQGGTPRGYFVFDFSEEDYRFRFKGVDRDESHQMTLYLPGLDSLDAHIDTLAQRPLGEVYATVYGACDSTRVCCQLDDGAWIEGEQVPVMDSNVARIQQLNKEEVFPTRHSRIDPIRRGISRQVWRFRFDPSALKGVHQLHVLATDPYGFEAQGSKVFYYKSPLSRKE